jgi:hypothetical protein
MSEFSHRPLFGLALCCLHQQAGTTLIEGFETLCDSAHATKLFNGAKRKYFPAS